MASERVQRQIDRLLDEAEASVSNLDWSVVRERARAVLGLEPGNPDAIAYFEAAVRELGDSEGASANPPLAQMTSDPGPVIQAPSSFFASGRYQVKEFLGEGGRKRVYMAHDSVLDRDVLYHNEAGGGEKGAAYARHMLNHGIFIQPSRPAQAYLCTAHTEEDIQRTVDAAASFFTDHQAALSYAPCTSPPAVR